MSKPFKVEVLVSEMAKAMSGAGSLPRKPEDTGTARDGNTQLGPEKQGALREMLNELQRMAG